MQIFKYLIATIFPSERSFLKWEGRENLYLRKKLLPKQALTRDLYNYEMKGKEYL